MDMNFFKFVFDFFWKKINIIIPIPFDIEINHQHFIEHFIIFFKEYINSTFNLDLNFDTKQLDRPMDINKLIDIVKIHESKTVEDLFKEDDKQ